MRYWDSSAILPLIVEEKTSDRATRYYEAFPELVVSWGASVECASALARPEREGALEARDITQAHKQLQTLQSTWNEVQPLDAVRTAAQRLLRLHNLRAADSLQLGMLSSSRSQAKDLGISLLGHPASSGGRTRGGWHRERFHENEISKIAKDLVENSGNRRCRLYRHAYVQAPA